MCKIQWLARFNGRESHFLGRDPGSCNPHPPVSYILNELSSSVIKYNVWFKAVVLNQIFWINERKEYSNPFNGTWLADQALLNNIRHE